MHGTEPSRVIEADRGAIVGFEDDVVVRFKFHRRRCSGNHTAGHAEVSDQDTVVIEVDQNELCTPAHTIDPTPLEPFDESGGQRKSQIGPPLDDTMQTSALELGRQASAYCFYFRQFRHDFDLECDNMPAT